MQDVLSFSFRRVPFQDSTLPIWKQNFWGEAPIDSTSKPLYLGLKDAEGVSRITYDFWMVLSYVLSYVLLLNF